MKSKIIKSKETLQLANINTSAPSGSQVLIRVESENFNKGEREIIVQDADFKNKAIAVRNKEIPSQSNTAANNYISRDLIRKKARGLGVNAYLGEVQQVSRKHIITEKGTTDKEKYQLPKSLVKQVDNISNTIYFNITIKQAQQFKRK